MMIIPSVALLTLVAAASTAAVPAFLGVSTYTISSLYTGDRVRDPFLPTSMGGAAPTRAADDGTEPAATDIHSLQLRGLMKDRSTDFAIFGSETGQTYLLRAGKLFDGRNKRVPGITGRIQIKQKRAELITADKDVQVFVLGETDENTEKDKKP
ncbi:MAG: hypothetical protein AAB262_10345 [Elusimicrobiota bacterium]